MLSIEYVSPCTVSRTPDAELHREETYSTMPRASQADLTLTFLKERTVGLSLEMEADRSECVEHEFLDRHAKIFAYLFGQD